MDNDQLGDMGKSVRVHVVVLTRICVRYLGADLFSGLYQSVPCSSAMRIVRSKINATEARLKCGSVSIEARQMTNTGRLIRIC